MQVFLSKSEKRRYYRNWRIKFYLGFGALALLGILVLYGALNLPFLEIKQFEVSGNVRFDDLRAEILKNEFAQLIGFRNFLSWPVKMDGVEVDKDYFGGILKLTSEKPERFAIWCSAECYWVNRRGVILGQAPDTEGSSISKINDKNGMVLIVGKSVLNENLFLNIVDIVDGIDNLPIRMENFSFNSRLQELTANGVRGERLIFSARFAPSSKAFAYLNDLILSGKLRNAGYVDLTVENRVYLK